MVACIGCVLVLSACGDIVTPTTRLSVEPHTTTTARTTVVKERPARRPPSPTTSTTSTTVDQRPAFYFAVEAQRLASARIPYNSATWIRVHNCEQPDSWHAGGHFDNGLVSAGGGLGFSVDAWRLAFRFAARRGVTLPTSMWDATPDEQMQGAQALLDATGGGPACL
jgi:hypothetical protein